MLFRSGRGATLTPAVELAVAGGVVTWTCVGGARSVTASGGSSVTSSTNQSSASLSDVFALSAVGTHSHIRGRHGAAMACGSSPSPRSSAALRARRRRASGTPSPSSSRRSPHGDCIARVSAAERQLLGVSLPDGKGDGPCGGRGLPPHHARAVVHDHGLRERRRGAVARRRRCARGGAHADAPRFARPRQATAPSLSSPPPRGTRSAARASRRRTC